MSSNEYMKKYMIERYRSRRKEAMMLLGNKCFKCGSDKKLEFDHIKRETKTFTITKLWSINKKDFLKEITKCQLLCYSCHKDKTRKDLGQEDARKVHGTLSSYRYCKCDLCLQAKKNWNIKYYARIRGQMVKAAVF